MIIYSFDSRRTFIKMAGYGTLETICSIGLFYLNMFLFLELCLLLKKEIPVGINLVKKR